mmetsp:Transcript_63014/g.176255  ORF Transcript_63014/g.176255 Transcript_63014/m.176255 type:complete len:203 (-) Transcript_63014:2-610(-)
MVEFSQTPIDKSQLPPVVVDHHIMGLHIPVHDPLGVAIVQSLQELEDVVANVPIRKSRVQCFEVYVVDMLEDEAWGQRPWISNSVKQLDDVRAAAKILQDQDLSLDLLLLDGLQNLDDALGLERHVRALEDLAVLPTADFSDYLIVVLVTPVDRVDLVVVILTRPVYQSVAVEARQALWPPPGARRHGRCEGVAGPDGRAGP